MWVEFVNIKNLFIYLHTENERRGAGVVDRAALEMRCTGNCTGGSNPSLSAVKGVNQVVTRFTPFFTPKNQGWVYFF